MLKKRLPSRKTWEFYIWTMTNEDGHCVNVFEHAGCTVQKWPNIVFENLAKGLGFDHLKLDTSLVGGYFANDNGDCLVCVPFGTNPEVICL